MSKNSHTDENEDRTEETTISRRKFLKGAAAAGVTTVVAAVLPSSAAHAAESGMNASNLAYNAGDWSADGKAAKAGKVPASKDSNDSSEDGTYRELNGNVFPANDASPIAPLTLGS